MSHTDPKRHRGGVIYVDADAEYDVHIDALPHQTGLWRCSGGSGGAGLFLNLKYAEGNVNDCTWPATSPRWRRAPTKKEGICLQNRQKNCIRGK